jgi:hypothetical protein
MTELSRLSHEEKVFLAGCIRAVVLADGAMNDAELTDVGKISQRLDFTDYEQCLDEYEEMDLDEEGFLREAGKITRPETQDLILNTVYELTMQNGAPSDEQEGVFKTLSGLWEKS